MNPRHWRRALFLLAMSSTLGQQAHGQSVPGQALRAVYIGSNPAHAVRDAATGTVRGAVVDITNEFARRRSVTATLTGAASAQAVIDAVRNGQADIGFVARNPERAGPVQFSQPYMLVQQTFIVSEGSGIKAIADIDRPNRKLGATRADSIALYLARTLKQGQLVELDAPAPDDLRQMLLSGKLDAFGANRQRLSDMLRSLSGVRLLPDDLYGVEQTIIVANDRADLLAAVNRFIEDIRASGFLRTAIERSGVVGLSVAPAP